MSRGPTATDITVRTRNPQYLDQTIQQLPGAAVVIEDSWDGDTCLVRVFGDPGFLKFAITNQGYGEVVEPGRPDAEVFE